MKLQDFERIVRQGVLLGPHTWFGLGGPAEYFAEPGTIEELAALVRRCHDEGVTIRVLGGGSNLLVRDEGVSGVVLRLSATAFNDIRVKDQKLVAGGGARLGHVVSTAVREGLAGLEPLVGIPGTLGGALRGNAGSHGGDVGQWVVRTTTMSRSGELVERSRNELVFSYRQCNIDDLVILGCEFELEPEDPQELTKRMQKNWIIKKADQPLGHQSTGCIFKNPRGISAGMLIDQAGLKGARVGGAEVSDRHANFIIAEPDATSRDVLQLIDLVQRTVSERLGVELETEIEVW
ncbi:MAG TPA: UDP-N-acetylmuramate dehydrogenase [Pirellulales bacterium]|jgi:UDP-N-acetylmuramate dehydrogenase|nr:UDP-N-acetylmuramate dehydrogenase [Pirellulales bacterium]